MSGFFLYGNSGPDHLYSLELLGVLLHKKHASTLTIPKNPQNVYFLSRLKEASRWNGLCVQLTFFIGIHLRALTET